MSNSGSGDVTEVFLNGFIFSRRRGALNEGSKDRFSDGSLDGSGGKDFWWGIFRGGVKIGVVVFVIIIVSASVLFRCGV